MQNRFLIFFFYDGRASDKGDAVADGKFHVVIRKPHFVNPSVPLIRGSGVVGDTFDKHGKFLLRNNFFYAVRYFYVQTVIDKFRRITARGVVYFVRRRNVRLNVKNGRAVEKVRAFDGQRNGIFISVYR